MLLSWQSRSECGMDCFSCVLLFHMSAVGVADVSISQQYARPSQDGLNMKW